jgi:Ca2+-binding RTX toxin-like protein
MTKYTGTKGNDQVQGTLDEANDFSKFGQGRDTLVGGDFDDIFRLTVDGQSDYIEGGAGIDTLDYSGADRFLKIDLQHSKTTAYFWDNFQLRVAETTEFYDIENVVGSRYNDTIIGNDQQNLIDGGAGGDYINGGLGTDTVTYANSKAGVTVDLSHAGHGFAGQVLGGKGFGGDAEGDTLVSIERLIGSGHDDTFISGRGDSRFTGGAGSDTFDFTRGIGHDTVTDFDVNADVIVLRADQVLVTSDDFKNVMKQDGTDVVIDIDDNSIVLENVDLNDLTWSNVWVV